MPSVLEYLLRFFIGGTVVSAFAVIGGIFRPRTFSGIFGAAPTIALSTLGIAFFLENPNRIATEGRSMILGAAAIFSYSLVTRIILGKWKVHSAIAAFLAYLGWFAVAFGLWFVFFG